MSSVSTFSDDEEEVSNVFAAAYTSNSVMVSSPSISSELVAGTNNAQHHSQQPLPSRSHIVRPSRTFQTAGGSMFGFTRDAIVTHSPAPSAPPKLPKLLAQSTGVSSGEAAPVRMSGVVQMDSAAASESGSTSTDKSAPVWVLRYAVLRGTSIQLYASAADVSFLLLEIHHLIACVYFFSRLHVLCLMLAAPLIQLYASAAAVSFLKSSSRLLPFLCVYFSSSRLHVVDQFVDIMH